MDMSLSKLWELVMDKEAWHPVHGGHKELDMIEWLKWTELDLDSTRNKINKSGGFFFVVVVVVHYPLKETHHYASKNKSFV